jgi:hypothetical protein
MFSLLILSELNSKFVLGFLLILSELIIQCVMGFGKLMKLLEDKWKW